MALVEKRENRTICTLKSLPQNDFTSSNRKRNSRVNSTEAYRKHNSIEFKAEGKHRTYQIAGHMVILAISADPRGLLILLTHREKITLLAANVVEAG